MKRRTFIGSLFAALGAICFPWKRRKRKKSLEEIKQEILMEYFRSPQARGKLAVGMAFPLRMRRNYAEIGKRIFLVEELPSGALPFYDREP